MFYEHLNNEKKLQRMTPDNTTPKYCEHSNVQKYINSSFCYDCKSYVTLPPGLETASTTPPTGWTAIKYYGHGFNFKSPSGEMLFADDVIRLLNRLHAINTASEVDVSDEKINEWASINFSPDEHFDRHVNGFELGAKTVRDLFLPKLAKAKAGELEARQETENLKEAYENTQVERNKYKADLAASQAEVERKDEALKKLRSYFGEHDKTTQEHLMFHVADKALNKP